MQPQMRENKGVDKMIQTTRIGAKFNNFQLPHISSFGLITYD
jgi:hypothetical protein